MQAHLSRVYATLAVALLVAAAGVCAELTLGLPPVLGTLLLFGSMIWLGFTPAAPEYQVSARCVCQRACVVAGWACVLVGDPAAGW